jgi:hypothetical protein
LFWIPPPEFAVLLDTLPSTIIPPPLLAIPPPLFVAVLLDTLLPATSVIMPATL